MLNNDASPTTEAEASRANQTALNDEVRAQNAQPIARGTGAAGTRPNRAAARAALGASVGLCAIGLTSTAAARQDPFAAPGAAPAATASPGAPQATASAPDAQVSATCEHITAALCDKQNNSMLALDAGYVAGSVFIAALIRAWFNKRATGSNAFRFLFPMLLAVAGAGALTGTDPARGADLSCCLLSPAFRDHVLLQDSTIGRAVLFGVLPAAVLYVLVVVIVRAIRR